MGRPHWSDLMPGATFLLTLPLGWWPAAYAGLSLATALEVGRRATAGRGVRP